MNFDAILPELRNHAAAEAEIGQRECCGLAIIFKGRLRYWPCTNISQNADQFEIDPEDYAAAEDAGEVVAICHSHVFINPKPSQADLVMCEKTGLPWIIVNHPTGSHTITEPTGYLAPLVGREYAHGILDCYQIVVDHYKQELGIDLPHFDRPDDWWLKGQNLYLDGFGKAGFVQVGGSEFEDYRKHDVLLMQVGSPVPNHAAIFMEDGSILQHIHGRLSSRDMFGGYWRKATTHVLRHKTRL